MGLEIRSFHSFLEERCVEAGVVASPPLRKVAVAAVVTNPCAGRYVEDLSPLTDGSVEVGREIASRAVGLMKPYRVESYAKAAVVGFDGEVEHAEAVLTTVFGDTMRDAVGGGKAWIPHFAKLAAPGSPLDIPLAHKDALFVRSHYDGMTIAISDAPRPR